MITVHHLNNSRSHRILWLLEEVQVPYEVVHHTRDPATGLAPPALRDIHPLGKAPIIVDGTRVLAESGTIIEYLTQRHGPWLVPAAGTEAAIRHAYWMHYAEGSAMPNLLMKLVFDQIETGPIPFYVRPVVRGLARAVKSSLIDPQLVLHLDFLEAELANAPWFTGADFTAADIQMSFPIQGAAARAGLDETRPRLMAWLNRIHARPAWTRAIERGGPYSLAV